MYATFICRETNELYCSDHAPPSSRRKKTHGGHVKSIKEEATARRELGLHGAVTSGPFFTSMAIPRFAGAQTLVISKRFNSTLKNDGVSRIPQLHPMLLGPVVLCDGKTIWSKLLSNGMCSLRWYDAQSLEESDALGAFIRADTRCLNQKYDHPLFPNAGRWGSLIGIRLPALLPHVLPDRFTDAPEKVANAVQKLGAIVATMPDFDRELMQNGATLSVLEVCCICLTLMHLVHLSHLDAP